MMTKERSPASSSPQVPFISVDTPLYQLQISPEGGVLAGVVLKQYLEVLGDGAPLKTLIPADGLIPNLVTNFVGGRKPTPVPNSQIEAILAQMEEGAAKPAPRIIFDEGDNVRVIDGPFTNFTGVVEEVRPEKQKLRVLVSIFGRATPVELEYHQVEKT